MSKEIPSFVHDAITKILKNEGGYQDDPSDRGNYQQNEDSSVVGTNRGITPYTYAAFVGKKVEDVTVEDMKNVSEELAREIYEKEYYLRPKMYLIKDKALQENVFDMGVNAGPRNAVKILQRLVGATPDGYLGKNTAKKVEKSDVTTNEYSDGRVGYYKDLIKNRPDNAHFLEGWINRADKYRIEESTPSYKLVDYPIRRGDTLFTIANNLGVDVEDLRHFNDSIRNTDNIYPEQVIRVPGNRGDRFLDEPSLAPFEDDQEDLVPQGA